MGAGVAADAHWVPDGREAQVAGRLVGGGLFYVGHGLPAVHGRGQEPALVDPYLSVDFRRPDWAGEGVPYWPSYGGIPPASRAAYLTWLASDRRHPAVPIGYVFLYFYGLERRLLADTVASLAARADADRVLAEVRALLDVYGKNHSFAGYAASFLDFVDVLRGRVPTADEPPPETDGSGEPSASLKVSLGRLALDGRPVPSAWALAWARASHFLRTPALRCPDEFTRLFTHRYRERFGDGLLVKPNRTTLTVTYVPASATFLEHVRLPPSDLPDVTAQRTTVRKLLELADDCYGELDAYSRYLGKHPDAQDSLAAVALLPDVLATGVPGGEATRLRDWAAASLADRPRHAVETGELTDRFPTATPGRLTKAEAVALAQLLAKLGYGIEPDVRFGSAVPKRGHTVLFRLEPGAPSTASPAHAAAMVLLHLAVAVSDADGEVSIEEQRHLTEHLEAALHLSTAERQRLDAYLAWLLADRPGLAGIRRRLEVLDQGQRAAIGRFMITVATADGTVTPSELKLLQRIYRLLELDPAEVRQQIRELLPPPAPAAGPVTVRPGTARGQEFSIPDPSSHPDPGSRPGPGRGPGRDPSPDPSPDAGPAPAPAGVALDPARVEAKLAESAAVSALLTSIFTDDEEPTSQPPGARGSGAPPAATPAQHLAATSRIAGLDAAHVELLGTLAAKLVWARSEVDALAAERRLMVDGALDTINDAAIGRCGEPVCEGDDPVEMNTHALQELLSP